MKKKDWRNCKKRG